MTAPPTPDLMALLRSLDADLVRLNDALTAARADEAEAKKRRVSLEKEAAAVKGRKDDVVDALLGKRPLQLQLTDALPAEPAPVSEFRNGETNPAIPETTPAIPETAAAIPETVSAIDEPDTSWRGVPVADLELEPRLEAFVRRRVGVATVGGLADALRAGTYGLPPHDAATLRLAVNDAAGDDTSFEPLTPPAGPGPKRLADVPGFPAHLLVCCHAADLRTLDELEERSRVVRMRLPSKTAAKKGPLALLVQAMADAVAGYVATAEAPHPYPEPGDEEGDLKAAEDALRPLVLGPHWIDTGAEPPAKAKKRTAK